MTPQKTRPVTFAVMQPYLFPYIGYYQLMDIVDCFIVYDNIEFTKKGWIHRNRILMNGEPGYITVNLEKGSDYLMVNERKISPVYVKERRRVLAKIEANYKNAPFFEEIMPFVRQCLEYDESNLFDYILYSIRQVNAYLGIDTEIVISSKIPIDHTLRNKHKLWAISKELEISEYINPIGGMDLYNKKEFAENGVNLQFHQSSLSPYTQVGTCEFAPALSIIDMLMNIGREGVVHNLKDFKLH